MIRVFFMILLVNGLAFGYFFGKFKTLNKRVNAIERQMGILIEGHNKTLLLAMNNLNELNKMAGKEPFNLDQLRMIVNGQSRQEVMGG